jgi:hypothetical protein
VFRDCYSYELSMGVSYFAVKPCFSFKFRSTYWTCKVCTVCIVKLNGSMAASIVRFRNLFLFFSAASPSSPRKCYNGILFFLRTGIAEVGILFKLPYCFAFHSSTAHVLNVTSGALSGF